MKYIPAVLIHNYLNLLIPTMFIFMEGIIRVLSSSTDS